VLGRKDGRWHKLHPQVGSVTEKSTKVKNREPYSQIINTEQITYDTTGKVQERMEKGENNRWHSRERTVVANRVQQ
jgi:hypothetical protein